MKNAFVLVLLALGLVLAGCPPRKVVQPEVQRQPTGISKEIKETTQMPAEVKPEEKTITEQRLAKIETKEEKPMYIEEKGLFEGHCDERGTNEYNLALGDRRAKAARDYLIALGIAANRIEMLSYGEEKPLCTEETDECWAKNRRAHFVILKEGASK
jgi:hypothetical protein